MEQNSLRIFRLEVFGKMSAVKGAHLFIQIFLILSDQGAGRPEK